MAAAILLKLADNFYTVGEVLVHTLAGTGILLELIMTFEVVTAHYVDTWFERKEEVIKQYCKAHLSNAGL